jgi:outer membrane protein assembly factor BamB
MPAELDEMFAALGRHADEIPLAPAGAARRRGRRRSRAQALVAAAAAVCLAATGIGAAARHSRQVNRPAPAASSGALPEVGTPLDFGAQTTDAMAAIAGGRVFTAWSAADGSTRLAASDLHTGAVVWSIRAPGAPAETFFHLQALPQALLLTLTRPDGDTESRTRYAFDPQDGRLRWKLVLAAADGVVVHRAGLVWVSASTGRTQEVDWATGRERWSLPAGADRPLLTLGMHVPGDDDRAGAAELPAGFTDDRLVQVTAAGRVRVRDIDTGALRRTVTSAALDPDHTVHTFVAYDGMLYNSERAGANARGYRIRVTDLSTDQGRSRVVLTEGVGHSVGGLVPCGSQRVCVADRYPDGRTTLAAIDARTGRRLWQSPAPDDSGPVGALHGRTLVSSGKETVLYDADGGQVLHTSYNSVGWLDADTLLIHPAAVAGPAARFTTGDRRITSLGQVPAASGGCTWTAERLACPTGASLRIWSLTG